MIKLERYQKVGWFIVLFNLWWIWQNANLYYGYHYTNLLYYFMYPDWVLFLNVLLAIIGILLGIKVLKRKMTERPALIRASLVFGSGQLIGLLQGTF